MFPALLDMTENESLKCLRIMELDAYSSLITAFRAQGPPTSDKLRLIKDVGLALHISHDRYKAEVRRVILDEKLNTIAYYAAGRMETGEEWIREGRRVIPLVARTNPHTVYSAIADEMADAAVLNNEQLPLPVHTERKRAASFSQHNQTPTSDGKCAQFRAPEPIKHEENKKRKLPFAVESSTLAQHLIGSQKMSRIQQLYRQRAKNKVREHHLQMKLKKEREFHSKQKFLHQHQQHHFPARKQKLPLTLQSSGNVGPKINIIQNISLPLPKNKTTDVSLDPTKNDAHNANAMPSPIALNPQQSVTTLSPQAGCSNENQAPRPHLPPTTATTLTIKPCANPVTSFKHVASPGPSSDTTPKATKATPPQPPPPPPPTAKKAIATKTAAGQKLIIVSNAQSIASTSILQRTLTIPFVKNVSMKSFDKFKIVSTGVCTSTLQLTPVAASAGATACAGTAPGKHKVVTVRATPTGKKVIPLAHLQALTAKGSIKMLPVGGRILTKTAATTTNTTPLYLMNNLGSLQSLTKSTPSTPMMVTCKPQEIVLPIVKTVENAAPIENRCVENAKPQLSGDKSSVLADILKASGVSVADNDDVEMHIGATQIPHKVPEPTTALSSSKSNDDVGSLSTDFEKLKADGVTRLEHERQTQVRLEKDRSTEQLIKDLEGDDSCDGIGSLDPGTGEYVLPTGGRQLSNFHADASHKVENTYQQEHALPYTPNHNLNE